MKWDVSANFVNFYRMPEHSMTNLCSFISHSSTSKRLPASLSFASSKRRPQGGAATFFRKTKAMKRTVRKAASLSFALPFSLRTPPRCVVNFLYLHSSAPQRRLVSLFFSFPFCHTPPHCAVFSIHSCRRRSAVVSHFSLPRLFRRTPPRYAAFYVLTLVFVATPFSDKGEEKDSETGCLTFLFAPFFRTPPRCTVTFHFI